jgi:hypothetical protein
MALQVISTCTYTHTYGQQVQQRRDAQGLVAAAAGGERQGQVDEAAVMLDASALVQGAMPSCGTMPCRARRQSRLSTAARSLRAGAPLNLTFLVSCCPSLRSETSFQSTRCCSRSIARPTTVTPKYFLAAASECPAAQQASKPRLLTARRPPSQLHPCTPALVVVCVSASSVLLLQVAGAHMHLALHAH